MRLFVGVAAAAGVVVSAKAAASEFERAFAELGGCHVSFGSCIYARKDADGNLESGGFAPQPSSATCTAFGGEWFQAFPSANEFEAATKTTPAGISLVRLPEGVKSDAFEATLTGGTKAAEFFYCDKATYAVLDGTVIPSTVGFSAPLPPQLKVSPLIDLMESSSASSLFGTQRRVRLSPSAAANYDRVSEAFRNHHEARRALGVSDNVEIEAPRTLSSDKAQKTLILTTFGSPSSLDFAAELKETIWVEPVAMMKTTNTDAVILTQTGEELGAKESLSGGFKARAAFWVAGIDGAGQIVGVGDSGLDTEHCFFADPKVDEAANKLVRLAKGNRTVTNDDKHRKVVQYVAWSDGYEGTVAGHGTHVAGSVAGSIAPELVGDDKSKAYGLGRSGNVFNSSDFEGAAPGAKIAMFDIGVAEIDRFIFPPDDYSDLFTPSYEVGARLHTNSWGGSLNAYDSGCQTMDDYVFEHQDFLPLFANGNSGPDALTVGTPATAKNLLSVGASQNTDRSFTFIGVNYFGNPAAYPCPSKEFSDKSCGDSMADFSSNGPTFDNRIKPDVVAPGFFIFSAGSSGGNGTVPTETCEISAKAGTSMATPITAGNTALVRQFFVDGFYPSGKATAKDSFSPMGALVKAVMVHGAEYMTGVSFNNTLKVGAPGPRQGFGRTTLSNSLFLKGSLKAGEKQIFIKGDFADMPVVKNTGDSVTYKFKYNAVKPATDMFRATLVWFDPAASPMASKAIVNDLDLVVSGPSGAKFFPNGRVVKDSVNTVEQVDIPAASLVAGAEYSVTVTGAAIRRGEQPFAVVVSGAFEVAPEAGDEEANESTAGFVWGAIIGGIVATVLMTMAGIYFFKPAPPAESGEAEVDNSLTTVNPKFDVESSPAR